MGEFRMPSLGADMDAGTIVEWKVRPGDEVHRGDVVAIIDTDKADIDAEIFEDGVIGDLLVDVGDKVPVGTLLATVVTSAAESTPIAPPAEAPAPVAQPAPRPPVHRSPEPVVLSPVVRHLAERRHVDLHSITGTGIGGTIKRADIEAASRPRPSRARVSPRARRLAEAAGVDLGSLTGTGPSGAIVGRDIELPPRVEPAPRGERIAQVESTPRADRSDRAATMQQRIAQLMERSNREIPHYWVTRDIDFSTAARWLSEHNEALPPAERMVGAALLLSATARAALSVPHFNGHWIDGTFAPAATVDLGIVIVLRTGGLLVPVLHDAQRMSADETMRQMGDLVRRARSGHLRSSEVVNPTITVSNLGDQGGDSVLGVIYPPQVALVGFGRVFERPWADGGMLGVRPIVRASVAGDHRASDGHQASRFLAAIDELLQSPDALQEVEP